MVNQQNGFANAAAELVKESHEFRNSEEFNERNSTLANLLLSENSFVFAVS